VEPLRRQDLRHRRQPAANVVAQRSFDVAVIEVDVDRDTHGMAPIERSPRVATTRALSGTVLHPGASSKGSDATITASSPCHVNSVSPQAVATMVVPSVSTRLRREP